MIQWIIDYISEMTPESLLEDFAPLWTLSSAYWNFEVVTPDYLNLGYTKPLGHGFGCCFFGSLPEIAAA